MFQEWSDSAEEDDEETLSREDSGIQVDKTPQDDADKKNAPPVVSWKGTYFSQIRNSRAIYFLKIFFLFFYRNTIFKCFIKYERGIRSVNKYSNPFIYSKKLQYPKL